MNLLADNVQSLLNDNVTNNYAQLYDAPRDNRSDKTFPLPYLL